MQKYSGYQYTPAPQTEWDKLPMSEKIDIIKVCVHNGITSLQDIRTAYNNYKGDRNIFEGTSDYSQKASEFGNFLAGGGEITYGKPYYSYDENGRKIDDTHNYNATLPEIVVWGNNRKQDYAEKARQERQRQRGIAKEYLTSTPTIANIVKGIEALVNSSSLVTTPSTVNPYMVSGDAPNVGIKGTPLNSTTSNLLKWLGKPLTYKPKTPLSKTPIEMLAQERIKGTSDFKYPGLEKMLELWKKRKVDLSKFGVEDLDDIYGLRKKSLFNGAPPRYTIANKIGEEYVLSDYQNGVEVGRTDLGINKEGNTFMDNIHNLTLKYPKSDPRRAFDVQKRGLNSAIAVAQSEGGEGVFTGNFLQSAPKQYPAIFGHPEREVVGKGLHTNQNMVPAGEYGIFGGMSGPKQAKSVEELWANGDKVPMELLPAPVWKLTRQSEFTPTKSYSFDPIIIDDTGKMHTDWNLLNIFRGLTVPALIGTAYRTSKVAQDE